MLLLPVLVSHSSSERVTSGDSEYVVFYKTVYSLASHFYHTASFLTWLTNAAIGMEEELPCDGNQHALEILQELNALRKERQSCDFIIKAASEEIHVHKNILIVHSEYFRAMFAHDTLENRQGCVVLKGAKPEVVKICINFMYCGKISVPDEVREELWHVADMLSVKRLVSCISQYYEAHLNENMFFNARSLAMTYHHTELVESCDKYAAEHFEAIAQLPGFKTLDDEYVSYLLGMELNTASEMNKAKAILNWVRFDLDTRRKFLVAFFENVKLSTVPVRYRQHLLEKEPLTSENVKVIKMLCRSFIQKVGFDEDFADRSNSIVAFDNNFRELNCFNPADGTWTRMHKLRNDMIDFSAVSLAEYIFVLMQKSVYRINFLNSNSEWEKLPDMIYDHGAWPPAVTDFRHIYACGRWLGSGPSQSIERYDVDANCWNILTDRTVTRGCICVFLNECIYCIGGLNGDKFFRAVDVFDLTSMKWTTAAPLLNPRGHGAGTAYHEKIYVSGGRMSKDSLTSMECYDSETNAWVTLSPMLVGRKAHTCLSISNRIYAVGDHRAFPSSLEKYNSEEDEWEIVELAENINLMILWSVGIYMDQ